MQYEQHEVFFAARFTVAPAGGAEHELRWLDPAEAAPRLFLVCHAWVAKTVRFTDPS